MRNLGFLFFVFAASFESCDSLGSHDSLSRGRVTAAVISRRSKGLKLVNSWRGDGIDTAKGAGFGFVGGFVIGAALKGTVMTASLVASHAAFTLVAVKLAEAQGLVTIHDAEFNKRFHKVYDSLPRDMNPRVIAQKLDLDGDGLMSREEVLAQKAKLAALASKNEHLAAGVTGGLGIGFTKGFLGV